MNYHYPSMRKNKSNDLEFVKSFVLIFPALLIYLSYLYLLVYYNSFDIDIFRYISINTIILHSLQSIGIVLISVFIGLIAYLTTGILAYDFFDRVFNWIRSKFEFFSLKFFALSFTFILCSILFIILYSLNFQFSSSIKNQSITFILFLSCFPILTGFLGYLSIILMFKGYSKIFVLLITITIASSYLTIIKGWNDVRLFKSNIQYKFIDGVNLKENYPNYEFKLIGKVDDYYFLKNSEEEGVLIKKFDDFKQLHIKTYRGSAISSN